MCLAFHVAIMTRKGKWDFVRTDENGILNVRIPIDKEEENHLIDTLERHFQSEPLVAAAAESSSDARRPSVQERDETILQKNIFCIFFVQISAILLIFVLQISFLY